MPDCIRHGACRHLPGILRPDIATAAPTPIMQVDLNDFARLFARSDGDILPAQDYADQIFDLVDCYMEM